MAELRLCNVAKVGEYGTPNIGAFSTEALEEVRQLVSTDAPDASPLMQALYETIEGVNVYHSAENHGRRLIAAVGPIKPFTIEGLMYTEGSELTAGTFALASVSTWISNTHRHIVGAQHLFNKTMTDERRDDIRTRFYRTGFGNWDKLYTGVGVSAQKIFWGLPVRGSTLITPVGNQIGDIRVPFRYIDWQDVLAATRMDVPAPLRELVMSTLANQHTTK